MTLQYVKGLGSNRQSTSVGFGSLASITFNSGVDNVGLGIMAGNKITTGSSNIIIGTKSGYNVVTGEKNTAVGHKSMYNTGSASAKCVAIGAYALLNHLMYPAVSIGAYSCRATTIAQRTTAVGYSALYSLTQNINNTAVGYRALYSLNDNSVPTNSTHNTALGANAGEALTTGNKCIIIGSNSLPIATTCIGSVMIGYSAGKYVTSASQCVGIGNGCLPVLTSGAGHVAIGASAGRSIVSSINSVSIGLNSTANGNNGIAIGGNSNTALAATSSANDGIAIGNADARAVSSIALGKSAYVAADGTSSISIGDRAESDQTSSIAIGTVAVSNGVYTISIGNNSSVRGSSSLVMGNSASAYANNSVAIGSAALLSMGTNSAANVTMSGLISIGLGAQIKASPFLITTSKIYNCIAIGTSAAVYNGAADTSIYDAICIGYSSAAEQSGAISIGKLAAVKKDNAISIGTSSLASTENSIVIGNLSTTTVGAAGLNHVAIGMNATVYALSASAGSAISKSCVALGAFAQAAGKYSISIGGGVDAATGARANHDYNISIGYNTFSSGVQNVILGANSSAVDAQGVALGFQANSAAYQAVQIGIGTNNTPSTLQFLDKVIYPAPSQLFLTIIGAININELVVMNLSNEISVAPINFPNGLRILGAASATQGATGTQEVYRSGLITLLADGVITAGNFIRVSTTTAGHARDNGNNTNSSANFAIAMTGAGALGDTFLALII